MDYVNYIIFASLALNMIVFSVQKKNAAVRFYRRLGYEIVLENEEDYIMLKDLS